MTEKFLTNRNILKEELENAAILKDLVKSLSPASKADKAYIEIVEKLADKFLKTFSED